MKKVLFIDRDGTLIVEPPVTEQIDSFDFLEFLPNVITSLSKVAKNSSFELVMVTNQDGLGTSSFPEDKFWGPQNLMMKVLENEGVIFRDVIIDKTFSKDNAPTRKPGIALMNKYINNPDYDLKNSYVIGDRLTDIAFAKNLGCKAIFINTKNISAYEYSDIIAYENTKWQNIASYLLNLTRTSEITRKTKETDIHIELNLEGTGFSNIHTGLQFFNHMLEQIPRHGMLDLTVFCKGDLNVDEHHTIEDVAIALGTAFSKALGDKRGIERYGFSLPMDDCLAQVSLDFSGRCCLVWETSFHREKIGDVPTEMFKHFFKSFSDSAQCNLNIKAEGENEHHKIEGIFKAFAKAIKFAVIRDLNNSNIPSTKGVL